MVKIIFSSTNYGPMWMPVVNSWLMATNYASRHLKEGKLGGIAITDRMYTHSAENALVKDFLAMEDATHLFMTESDMILPTDSLIKLIELDKDIASGIYFLRNGNGQSCLYKKTWVSKLNPYPHSPVTLFPEDKPFRIDCPGVGCVLIKRKVLEGLKPPCFDLKEYNYGSDMYFYTNVKNAGFEVWAHPGVLCSQIDYVVWSIEDYHERLKLDPNFVKSGYIIGDSSFYDGKVGIQPEVV